MELYTYEEIEKEIELINLDYKLSQRYNQFTKQAADELLDRCFALIEHFYKQSRFKRIFKRMATRRLLEDLTIIIYETPTK